MSPPPEPPDGVAPDGSPVAVYLAAPTGPLVELVHGAIPPASRVLDLGCGVGRLANGLAARGHEVTGVDESPAMLAHLDPAVRPVEARIEELALGDVFDVVVLASHLVNTADVDVRQAWLASCRRHVAADGQVLIERHLPTELGEGGVTSGRLGPVEVQLEVRGRHGDAVTAEVTYALGGRTWRQPFTALLLDDAQLDAALHTAGLALAGAVSEDGRWVRARPVPRGA